MREHIARCVLVAIACFGLFALAGGCGAPESTRTPLTERQRDSVLAKSPLPGAAVVGGALDVADSARARAARGLPDSD